MYEFLAGLGYLRIINILIRTSFKWRGRTRDPGQLASGLQPSRVPLADSTRSKIELKFGLSDLRYDGVYDRERGRRAGSSPGRHGRLAESS